MGVLGQEIEVRIIKNLSHGIREKRDVCLVHKNDKKNLSDTNNTQTAQSKRRKTSNSVTRNHDDNPQRLVKSHKKQQKKKREWIQKTLTKSVHFTRSESNEPVCVEEWREKKYAPVDIFRQFFDDTFLERVVKETVTYAMQNGHSIECSPNDLMKYMAILLLSGYVPVKHRRMFWETRADAHNALVSSAMTRNRFELIHRFFHLNDNSNYNPAGRIYKVRPLVEHLNAKFQEFGKPLGDKFSLDEAMEPYYEHHYAKQFIRGKPVRYGFKFWCLTTPEGYLLKFEPYSGAGGNEDPNMTLGSSITQKFCVGYLSQGSTVFIDNYFNSLPLLESFTEKGLKCIGTIRADRVEKAPLRDIKKKARGSMHAIQDEENSITLIRWHDNNQVTVATNVTEEAVLGEGQCRRWDRREKKYKYVSQPSVVQEYNRYMGGVDLYDKLRGAHRLKIRSKKWYWPHVRFCINGAVVNAWLLYRRIDKDMPLLEFTRRIVLALLSGPGFNSPRRVRPSKISRIPEEIRYDGQNHLVDATDGTQRRCGACGKCAKFQCIKCNIGLHPKKCFVQYHMRK